MTYREIIAALEGSSSNTDSDPRWLAATILRGIPPQTKLKVASHDRLLAAAKGAARLLVPGVSIGTLAACRDMLEAAIAKAEKLAP